MHSLTERRIKKLIIKGVPVARLAADAGVSISHIEAIKQSMTREERTSLMVEIQQEKKR